MKVDGIDIQIVEVETLEGSPARCKIVVPNQKAIIRIAKDLFQDYSKETKMFIILHELGHAVLNTGNEIEVDRWAFKQYAKTNLSMKGCVFALTKVIDGENNPEHSERIIRQFYRAKHINFLKGKTSWKRFQAQKHS